MRPPAARSLPRARRAPHGSRRRPTKVILKRLLRSARAKEPATRGLAESRSLVRIGGVDFDNVTMDEALERIGELIELRRPALVVTPNVDHVVRVQHDPQYAAIVRRADLVLPDGQPLVWLSRLLGEPLKERVAGSDLFPRLCGYAAERGWRVFLLGGAPGAAERARDVLVRRHPALQVVGTHCPPIGFDTDPAECERTLASVVAVRPQLVFVGLGSPKQERWIVRNMLRYQPAVSIGVGISFSFVAGDVKRAPRWMQRRGLEWLHRVYQEPRRLAGRYFLRGWRFLPLACINLARGHFVARQLQPDS
jgi:N-acetylglucosaminyldiphosphoundecaprenol N-acetyl-beta-D-mannosaminyltransferase